MRVFWVLLSEGDCFDAKEVRQSGGELCESEE